jgi:hypothetical protein
MPQPGATMHSGFSIPDTDGNIGGREMKINEIGRVSTAELVKDCHSDSIICCSNLGNGYEQESEWLPCEILVFNCKLLWRFNQKFKKNLLPLFSPIYQ